MGSAGHPTVYRPPNGPGHQMMPAPRTNGVHDGALCKHDDAEPATGEILMAGDLNGLSHAIGMLQAQMETLTAAFEKAQEATQKEHRTVHDIVAATAEANRVLVRDVEEMKPLVEDYREKRAEARGAQKLVKVVYVLGGSLGGIGFWKVIEAWFGKHP